MSAGAWQEAQSPDGRPYYWNTVTKETRWEKPEDLAAAPASDPSDQPWTEHTHTDGRKYYHNPKTNATVWDMPDAFRQAQAKQQAAPVQQQAPQQNFVAGGGRQQQYPNRDDRDRGDDRRDFGRDRGDDRREYERRDRSDNPRSNFVPATTNEPEYRSFEEAEAAFMGALKKAGVQLDWDWERAMHGTIKDPQFRALKDPKERRTAFDKYLIEQRAQNKEREKERVEKLRHDFTTMLQSHPEIKHNTRWKTARPIIEGETIFRSAGSDTERRQLFEEYVHGLRKDYAETRSSDRKAALGELSTVFRSLDLDPDTSWRDAQAMIQSDNTFKTDAKFKSLTNSDVLTGFENHMKALERTFMEGKQREKNNEGRDQRKNRDNFLALLRKLQANGQIKAGTKWMQVRPLIEDDEHYKAILSQSGSSPIDLFWDIVEEEERQLRGRRNDVLDVLDDKQFEITQNTTAEEYMVVMQGDKRTTSVHEDDLKLIFQRLHDKVIRRNEEDKYHAERNERRAIDALRSRIKHLEPPVRLNDTWEADVRPRLERYDEYRALDTDDLRRQAFDKVMRRLKEKADEAEARRAERHRASTNGRRRSRDGHSRTPEVDAYEADRRRATAAREKQYRKSENTGLSPESPRRRERYDRYDDADRYEHGRLAPTYDRERRRPTDYDREPRTRNDDRDPGLDYGEGRAGSMSGASSRRRKASDAEEEEGVRKTKRVKRESESKSGTPSVRMKEEDKEEEELKSGSEEGEIEEG